MKRVAKYLPANVRRELVNSYMLSDEHQELLITAFKVAEELGYEKCKSDVTNSIKIMELGRYKS